MNMDWIWGLIGGGLIGLGAAVYLLGNGRIMGASGIIGGLVDGSGHAHAAERIAFLAALVAVPAVIWTATGAAPDTRLSADLAIVTAAGLLVGIGSRVANGCTSGHGVCGISRLSLRGIVATAVYLIAGAVAVLVFRHALGVI